MGRPCSTSIFISYARKDGADLARRLQVDLASQGFDAWLDAQRLAGGAIWTTEIERAIDNSRVVLALMSPGSYVSEICRAEQLRSLRKGKRVIPLLAAAGSDIPLHLEAKQYRDFTGANSYPSQFKVLLEDIRGDAGIALKDEYRTTRVTYVTTPSTVVNYIERPEALAALRDALFADHTRGPLALTALAGMGGIGKTVLAHALTRNSVVQDAFPDGIIWITIGKEQTSDLVASFREVGKALGDDLGRYDTLSAAINQYKTALAQKAVLIVVDDIWKKSDLEPFLADSERSRLLFTTRDVGIARFIGARQHTAELPGLDQARKLLAAWAGLDGKPRPAQMDPVIGECGKLPLALAVIGAMLREATTEEWDDTLNLLRKADLSGIADRLPPGQESFFRAVEVSFKALAREMQEHYKALAVLLEDMAAPLPILRTLWGVSEPEARRIGRHFVHRSLAQHAGEFGIRLHDLQLDYVRAQHPDREALDLIHGAVRLSSHVIERDPKQFASQMVGRLLPHQELPRVRQFIESVIKAAPRPWLWPLAPALSPPGAALVCTMAGHRGMVTAVAVTPDGAQAISASYDHTLRVWDLKTGKTLRTLGGHRAEVWAVAVTPDGGRAISASWDSHHTLTVWDLKTGQALRTLEGHCANVWAVAVTPDGQQTIAASEKTLTVWDLKTGKALRTLEGHGAEVWAVAVTQDGGRAISGSGDGTLKVWDLKTGKAVCTLEGHSGPVTAVAVTQDSWHAISGCDDRTLKVWDLKTGHALRTLEGHGGTVRGVAVTPDGGRAVSASEDETLKVWDLTRQAARMREGHRDRVYAVAAIREGGQAISASADKTLKVWDLKTGQPVRTLEGPRGTVMAAAMTRDGGQVFSAADNTLTVWELKAGQLKRQTLVGHSKPISAVAVTRDGGRAVSASEDETLVWDLKTGKTIRKLMGHPFGVTAVAVTPDGEYAILACGDSSLGALDLKTGRSKMQTLEGHGGTVYAVAVTPDGGRAISASWDGTLKVWDLETAKAVRTLEGHSGPVFAVAVPPEGGQCLSASWDKTLKVWDLETGSATATFTFDVAALCCAFAGGRKIVAGDASGRVHLLSLEPGDDN